VGLAEYVGRSHTTKVSDGEGVSSTVIYLKLLNVADAAYRRIRIAIQAAMSDTDGSATLLRMDDPVGPLITISG